MADRAFDSSNLANRPRLRALILRQVGLVAPSQKDINSLENQEEQSLRTRLNLDVIYLNLIAVVAGGVASYWFAGRTLRPIEEAHESQSRFASDASHELRTPLTAMRTENEVFLRQKNFSEAEARDQIVSNLEEIQRLEQLSNNLLALSKFDGDDEIKLSKISSTKVVNLAKQQVDKNNPKNSKRLEVKVEDSTIHANADNLAQIISIFVDNALKYSPKDKPVILSGNSKDDYYEFHVDDQGPGISKTDMPHIFERLYRGDKTRSRTTPGHGLGLSLAKEIAQANQAGIRVANLPGGGARFTLSVSKV
ncbi:MAG TPA: HAMP domain-containing sensor histidine kinase [Candidatus Saccharimonadales bacterium]|nr:HAMP domain-containing sensor histidine kinase [Candidatus Saccharimonadales bacterium]